MFSQMTDVYTITTVTSGRRGLLALIGSIGGFYSLCYFGLSLVYKSVRFLHDCRRPASVGNASNDVATAVSPVYDGVVDAGVDVESLKPNSPVAPGANMYHYVARTDERKY
jgi:hypothetical protein